MSPEFLDFLDMLDKEDAESGSTYRPDPVKMDQARSEAQSWEDQDARESLAEEEGGLLNKLPVAHALEGATLGGMRYAADAFGGSRAREAYMQQLDDEKARNPYVAFAGEAAGGVMTGGALGRAAGAVVPQGASLVGRAASAAGRTVLGGTLPGAAAGYMTSGGDPEAALIGGALGTGAGLVGEAVPAVAGTVQKLRENRFQPGALDRVVSATSQSPWSLLHPKLAWLNGARGAQQAAKEWSGMSPRWLSSSLEAPAGGRTFTPAEAGVPPPQEPLNLDALLPEPVSQTRARTPLDDWQPSRADLDSGIPAHETPTYDRPPLVDQRGHDTALDGLSSPFEPQGGPSIQATPWEPMTVPEGPSGPQTPVRAGDPLEELAASEMSLPPRPRTASPEASGPELSLPPSPRDGPFFRPDTWTDELPWWSGEPRAPMKPAERKSFTDYVPEDLRAASSAGKRRKPREGASKKDKDKDKGEK